MIFQLFWVFVVFFGSSYDVASSFHLHRHFHHLIVSIRSTDQGIQAPKVLKPSHRTRKELIKLADIDGIDY